MARLILVRHGQSVANVEERFTIGDHEPLSPLGREQARAAGREIVERFDPVALYASPFVRALETARLIGAAVGLEPRVIPELREQDFGELGGRPYAEVRRELTPPGSDPWRFQPPGGETLVDVAYRTGPVLDRLAAEHRGEEILVVSHGGVMAALHAWARADLDFQEPPVLYANAAGYVLERRGRRYTLVLSLKAPLQD